MSHAEQLHKRLYRNWVKAALGLKYLKDGIVNFVDSEVKNQHTSFLNTIGTPPGLASVTCGQCSKENVLKCPTKGICFIKRGNCSYHKQGKLPRPCPNSVCDKLVQEIEKQHRYGSPSWKNTDATKWCTNHWELAKCYMASSGYENQNTAAETDCTGILSVAINGLFMQNVLAAQTSQPGNIFVTNREARNSIMHSSNLEVTDVQLGQYIDDMIDLLNDKQQLVNHPDAITARQKLNQLKSDKMVITNSDELEVCTEALKAIEEKKQAALQALETKLLDSLDNISTKQQELVASTSVHKTQVGAYLDETRDKIAADLQTSAKTTEASVAGKLQETLNVLKHAESDCQKKQSDLQEQFNTIQQDANYQHIQQLFKSVQQDIHQCQRDIVSLQRDSLSLQIEMQLVRDSLKTKVDELVQKQGLQALLIHLSKSKYLSTPLAARQKLEADILDVYVKPSMQSVDPWKTNNQQNENINVNSLDEIFFKDAKRCCNIYVSGDSGCGKTTLCQKLISAWCLTHSDATDDPISSTDLVKTMEDFEYLFYIPLRHMESEYHVEEMIKAQFLKTDPQREVFSRILEKESERCLIILDGLDEWITPSTYKKSYGVTKGLPDRNDMYKYTILTTSRPWKLEVLRLATSEIDQQIKVSGIDDEAASKYIENVVHHLNARNGSSKSASDFEKELESNKLSQFKTIPVMLRQLILLWYSGKTLGKSQCDIYSGMIDLLLTQAEMRDETLFENVCRKSDLQLPECFSDKSKCKECVPLIYSLAKLAFETLISKNRETSLVFEQSVAKSHGVAENVIQTCLKVGIMSQDIVPDLLTDKTSLSFLHKSYQEYLAALYITMREGDDKIIEHIFSVCNTVQMLLEMSKVVLFVSGMNPAIAEKLLPGIRNVTGKDCSIQQYRREVEGRNEYIKNNHAYIETIQEMIIDCMKESSDNGHDHLNLPLDDIYIRDYRDLEALQHQVTQNTANIKSVNIYCKSRYSDLLQHIVHCESLEKIVLRGDLTNMSLDNFTNMLNLPKIVALGLNDCVLTLDQKCSLITSLSLRTVLRKLVALRLSGDIQADSYITLTHDQICTLMTCLSQRTQLTQIVLERVQCSNHGPQCRYQLDLSQNKQLQKLTLWDLYIDKVTLNPAEMTDCSISYLHIPGAAESLLRCLHGATKLQTLVCEGLRHTADIDSLEIILPTLVSLRKVKLLGIDLSDRNILLSPQMMNLEYVGLWVVTWTDAGVCEFVASIPDTPHPVTCELLLRGVEYTRVRDYIHSSPRFVVTRYYPGGGYTWINFHTQQPGEGTRPQK